MIFYGLSDKKFEKRKNFRMISCEKLADFKGGLKIVVNRMLVVWCLC